MSVGVNVHRWDAAVRDALLAIRPPLLVVSNPDWATIERCKAEFPCTVVLRVFPDANNADNKGVPPDALAVLALQAVQGRRDLVDAVQGYNEVITSGNVEQQGPWELGFVRRVQADGVPVVALNAAVGNLEPAHMAALADVFREAAAVGYHGYVPNQLVYQMSHPDNTYFLQRPIKMWAPALGDAGTPLDRRRLLFTETGTQLPPSPGMHPIEYAALLVAIQEWAEMVGIGGTAAFTLSAHEPWRTEQPFEFIGTDTAHFLAYHNRNHPSAPPLISIPQAQASPADPIEHHGGPAGPPEREIIVVNADEKPFEAGPGINDLAAQLGEAVVGTPNMDEEYIGDRLSLQFRDLDDGAEGVIMHYLDNNGRHHQLFFAGRS